MKDGVIAETGNSRYLRTIAGIKQLCPTYDSFLDLFVRGELPIDWAGKNPDGWAQQGTDLNKANLLTDATAALMDLGPEATPNEMFAELANEIVALKTSITTLQNKINSLITYGTASMAVGAALPTGTIYIKYE